MKVFPFYLILSRLFPTEAPKSLILPLYPDIDIMLCAEFIFLIITGIDVINQLKTRAITKFGRPNWDEAFTRAKTENPEEKYIGVFYCGPNGLAKVLGSQCKKHTNSQVGYDFMKESFG